MQDQKKKERERQQRIRREAAEASGEEYSRRMSTSSVDSGIGPLGLGVPTADSNHPSWMKDGVKVDPQVYIIRNATVRLPACMPHSYFALPSSTVRRRPIAPEATREETAMLSHRLC